MESWLIWIIAGAVMIFLEIILPGAVIVFLGVSAFIVGLGIYFNLITSVFSAFLSWFIISIFLLLFLRSMFVKYFEGDSKVQNVDEDEDLVGSIVEIVEEIKPYKDGRVKFRDTTWSARSEEEFVLGQKAIIKGRDGNILLIKSL